MDAIQQLFIAVLGFILQVDLSECAYYTRYYRSYYSYYYRYTSYYNYYYSSYYNYYYYYYYSYYYYNSYYGYSTSGGSGWIAGVVVGCILAVIIIVVVTVICCKMYHAKANKKVVIKPTPAKTKTTVTVKTNTVSSTDPPKIPQQPHEPFKYYPNIPGPSYTSQDPAYPPPAFNYGFR